MTFGRDREYDAEAFQRRFFSGPNRFAYDEDPRFSSDPIIAQLGRSLLQHRRGNVDRPVLLPFQESDAGPVVWFACAEDGAPMRAMASELDGFIGQSFAHFASFERAVDAADQHMNRALLHTCLTTIRFEASKIVGDARITQQWGLYTQLLDRRPRAPVYVPQTFEQLRASFDRALSARDGEAARTLLGSLHDRFRLSAENRLFLEVRLFAALERWDDISRHPLLPTLIHLSLPRETYGDVMEGMYQADVRSAESARELDSLLDAFRGSVESRAAHLFRSRGTSDRPVVHKSFLLHELVQPNPDGYVASKLLANVAAGAFGRLDEPIRDRVLSLLRLDPRTQARQALEDEKFDRAYELYWSLDDDFETLTALVLCAREAEDPAKASVVLGRLTGAPQTLRTAVRDGSPHRVKRIEELASRLRPATHRFSEQLHQADGELIEDFVERWRELAHSSDAEDVMRETDIGQVAAQRILDQAVSQPEIFEQLYPLWYELFVDRCPPDRCLVPVYEALIETLRVREGLGAAELELLHQTLATLVKVGVSPKTYTKVVDEIGAVFAEVRSPQVLTWALSVCDTLFVSPVGDVEARVRFLTSVTQACLDYATRLEPMQRAVLQLLSAEGGLPEPRLPIDAAAVRSDGGPQNSRASVAFYSLDVAAAKRASDMLIGLYPSIRIECTAELVCSPRLRKLAQGADVFVFAWKSSKHAAYDCVKAALRDKNVLRMAPGGGATSLLATAVESLSRIPAH
jgi:hypothetical protein